VGEDYFLGLESVHAKLFCGFQWEDSTCNAKDYRFIKFSIIQKNSRKRRMDMSKDIGGISIWFTTILDQIVKPYSCRWAAWASLKLEAQHSNED